MAYIIVGLGNPGDEYRDTRHNTGRMMVQMFAKHLGVETDGFSLDKKINALTAKAKVKKTPVMLILPETFMNKSGKSVGALVTTAGKANLKKAAQLVVVYDDFNLPLGRIKISFNRSSGGHNGLESIIKAANTEAFLRIRIGVAPENAKGNAKVPSGDAVIEKFILSPFKPSEVTELKKVSTRVNEAIEMLINEGRDKAMSLYNAG